MSKFDRVLGDDWLPLEFQSGNDVPVTSLMVNLKTLKSIVKQTEQAVLAKIAEQEPVAWRVHPFDYGVGVEGAYAITQQEDMKEVWERKEWEVTPLYAHPMPSSKVNLDSSNHIADMRKKVKENHIPDASKMVGLSLSVDTKEIQALLQSCLDGLDGWQLVPVKPTKEMHLAARDWSVRKYGKAIGLEASYGCYKTMLAAAPKYTGDSNE